MKRKLALILLLCFSLTLMLVGCGSQSSDNEGQTSPAAQADDSWNKIQEKGYFVMGLDDAFPPMGFRDEANEIVGFDIDMAKEAAKRMGVEVEFQAVVWETKTEELNCGNIDVIWNGFTITEERLEKMAFTEPYLKDKQIIVVTPDSEIKGKSDLAGKDIGIQAASSAIEAVEADKATYEQIKDNLLEFESNDLALRDLKGGGVDAVVVDEVVGRYYITKHPDDYRVLKEDFGEEEFGVGMRKDDQAFLQELNKTLAEMKVDGTSSEISQKWFDKDLIK